jgi:superoxide dismutase, Fe-Mn family
MNTTIRIRNLSRRDVLRRGAMAAAATAAAPLLSTAAHASGRCVQGTPLGGAYPFSLPALPYALDALEPHIDAQTMGIHHDKHHGAYVQKLNEAIGKKPELQKKSLHDLLTDLGAVPEDVRSAVRNHGGGHANHCLFWEMLSPKGGKPAGELAKAIDAAFGGLDALLAAMSDAGMKRFGSGWAWLVLDRKEGKSPLLVTSTANQDSPFSEGQCPLLGVDVWEHAYYLKYQNRRADYLKAWQNVINWDFVSGRYAALVKA